MYALAGMAIKMAGATLTSVEVLFWRNVLSLLILSPWILWYWPRSLRPAHTGLMVFRAVTVVIALLCYYHAVTVIPLAAGALGGLSAVAIWRMPMSESAIRIAVFFSLIGTLITAGPALAEPRLPPMETWWPLVMLGVFSTAAHVLYARGCLVAPTDRVTTLNYTAVFFAAALGWMLWDERVDWFMAAGTVLVIGASVIAVRVRRRTVPG
jgi:drug/metabolite transporter (DMT)-like permease